MKIGKFLCKALKYEFNYQCHSSFCLYDTELGIQEINIYFYV